MLLLYSSYGIIYYRKYLEVSIEVRGEGNGSLDGRREFLSHLARVSSQVSELKHGVVISFDSKGDVLVSSFGFDPLGLANTLSGIADAMRKGISEPSPEEEMLKMLSNLSSLRITDEEDMSDESSSK